MNKPVNPWEVDSDSCYDVLYVPKTINKDKTDKTEEQEKVIAKGISKEYKDLLIDSIYDNTGYPIEIRARLSTCTKIMLSSVSREKEIAFPLDLKGRVRIRLSDREVGPEHPFGKHYKILTNLLISYQKLINKKGDEQLYGISTFHNKLKIFIEPLELDMKTTIQNYNENIKLVELSDVAKSTLLKTQIGFALIFSKQSTDKNVFTSRETIAELNIFNEQERRLKIAVENEKQVVATEDERS